MHLSLKTVIKRVPQFVAIQYTDDISNEDMNYLLNVADCFIHKHTKKLCMYVNGKMREVRKNYWVVGRDGEEYRSYSPTAFAEKFEEK